MGGIKNALIVLVSITVASCVHESASLPSEHGRWSVAVAERGGRITSTLDAAYFQFDTATAKLTTNLTSEELRLDYRMSADRKRITLSGSDMLESFRIEALTDTTMVLSTEIRETPFRFELQPTRE